MFRIIQMNYEIRMIYCLLLAGIVYPVNPISDDPMLKLAFNFIILSDIIDRNVIKPRGP